MTAAAYAVVDYETEEVVISQARKQSFGTERLTASKEPTKAVEQHIAIEAVEEIGMQPHTTYMSTQAPTDLLDAKLQVIETRMDARIQRIEDKMDAFVEANKETQVSVKSLKLTIVVTAISTVLAIVLGVAAFNSTVLSNMVAAFESGKNTSAAQAQVQQQLRDTQALLESIKQQQSTPSK